MDGGKGKEEISAHGGFDEKMHNFTI